MPNTPAIDRFNKLIDDISRLYIKARNMDTLEIYLSQKYSLVNLTLV